MGLFDNGLPSEPTMCIISQNIDNEYFADKFNEFITKFMLKKNGKDFEILNIDGKNLNGTKLANGRSPDNVSVHSESNGMTVCTKLCDEKSNEITTYPAIIDKAVREGDIVTFDAMGCQEKTVNKLREKKAHFVIQVKANQKQLRWTIEDRIESAKPVDTYKADTEIVGGRIETRSFRKYNGSDVMVDKEKWGSELKILVVETHTIFKSTKRETNDVRYYITDLDFTAKELGEIARKHWSCEVYHWHLDRNMKQDSIKRKRKSSAQYLDTIQRLCLNLLSKWRQNRKKFVDRNRGNSELMLKCQNNFTFIKEILEFK